MKVGDRVRVLPGNGWIQPCIGTVSRIDPDAPMPISVKPDGDCGEALFSWWLKEEYVCPYAEFKAGDKVRRRDDGRIDTVVDVPGDPSYDQFNFAKAGRGFRLANNSWDFQKNWELISEEPSNATEAVMLSGSLEDHINLGFLWRQSLGQPTYIYGQDENEALKKLQEETDKQLFNLLGIPQRKSFMENVIDLFKSPKQKLFEKYIFIGDKLNMNSPIVQKVILKALEKELLEECKKAEKEEC